MEPIKTREQTILLTSDREVERVAREAFKLFNYSFRRIEEAEADSDHAFIVDGGVDEDDDEEDILQIRLGMSVPLYRSGLLLDLLCKDGLLAPGNYLVQVGD